MRYRDAGEAGRAAIAAAVAGGADGNDLRVLCAVLSVTALYSRANYPCSRRELAERAGLDSAHADRIVRRSLARLARMGAIARVAGPGRTPLIGLPVAPPTGQGDPRWSAPAGELQPDKGTPVQPDKGTPVLTRARPNLPSSRSEEVQAVAVAPPAPAPAPVREAPPPTATADGLRAATERDDPPTDAELAREAIAPVCAIARNPPTAEQLRRIRWWWNENPDGVAAVALRVAREHAAIPFDRPLGALLYRLQAGDHLRDRLELDEPPSSTSSEQARSIIGAAPFMAAPPGDLAELANRARAVLQARWSKP